MHLTAVAGLAAALIAGSVVSGTFAAGSTAESLAPPDPTARALAAADRAAANGLDALRKGPHEQFDRRGVFEGGKTGEKDLSSTSRTTRRTAVCRLSAATRSWRPMPSATF